MGALCAAAGRPASAANLSARLLGAGRGPRPDRAAELAASLRAPLAPGGSARGVTVTATQRRTDSTLPTARRKMARGGVLVIGGGFAGSYVARGVGEATIVNPTNYMLYTPLLPEAAAGSIDPRRAVVPLRTMAPDAELVLGSAVALDPERRIVEVETESGPLAIAYADLVIALGSATRMPPVPGLAEHAIGFKDLSDAIRLRNHVLHRIELADAVPEDAERHLTFVVAGAGYAGVEAIAELQELVAETLRRHGRLTGMRQRWMLVDAAPRILGEVPDGLARFAASRLERRGVEILTDTMLESGEFGAVTLSEGRRLATHTVIWTAGIAPHPLDAKFGLPVDDHGRVRVDETLRVVGTPHVWALGDSAAVPIAATPQATDPPTSLHAMRQARRLAANLGATPRAYSYRTWGQMATLGRRHGIALIGKVPIRGLLGWLIARGYHLLQLPFHAWRARVFADWTTAALFRR